MCRARLCSNTVHSQAASGVNYCYLVVWGSITGTDTVSPPTDEQTPRGLFLLAFIFRHYWSEKKEKKSLRKLDQNEHHPPHSALDCQRVQSSNRRVFFAARRLFFNHISLLIATFFSDRWGPKAGVGSFYSSLLVMNKTPNEGTSFRWRPFRVFVAPEDFWHFQQFTHFFTLYRCLREDSWPQSEQNCLM